ncbi:Gfo/Idh/MocA family protein [Bryobacter aggregatus]|uniref:Gfo/Idh/MocA family protein n=1 Tax=Bryobacter aggregatus TaxID=360054 RepID=UPI0004E1FEA3|nr:Gfo/Idh/MocA family oxidoreductase [Bryobacter aggregatus]
MDNRKPTRRDASLALGAAFTTSIFTGQVKGANDRISVGFIGLGAMGSGNLNYAMKVPGFQPAALCDVYQPHLERAEATARRGGIEIKGTDDFRKILADKSIDAVCISTPDHWHAYMTVEACKAGKDVYVEKPASVYVDEGTKMVAAARKYRRVVQAGTMQRSGGYFKKAAELVKSGVLGKVTFCHTWQAGVTPKEGYGNPADTAEIPPGLNWDMWLGPAPKVPFNANRWGVKAATFPTFRYFWDYAGGAMTDWGVHLIDPLHQCFDEVMPTAINSQGGKLWVNDNRDTPDTLLATFEYPGFLASYESRTANPMLMFGQNAGTSIHGTEATLVVTRSGCWLIPNAKSEVQEQTYEKNEEMRQMNVPHWENWLACIKSREKPTSDIETCVRSSTVCILANLSLRHKTRLDWDEKNWTVKQNEVKQALKAKYRSPWKLEV